MVKGLATESGSYLAGGAGTSGPVSLPQSEPAIADRVGSGDAGRQYMPRSFRVTAGDVDNDGVIEACQGCVWLNNTLGPRC